MKWVALRKKTIAILVNLHKKGDPSVKSRFSLEFEGKTAFVLRGSNSNTI